MSVIPESRILRGIPARGLALAGMTVAVYFRHSRKATSAATYLESL